MIIDLQNIDDIGYSTQDLSYVMKSRVGALRGFDTKWYTMLSCKPILFNDVDYYRTKSYINNTITEREMRLYREGKISKVYATFEHLLMDNIQSYDRIIGFCTLVFLRYMRTETGSLLTEKHIKKRNLQYYFDMTPTQVYCAALTSNTSTKEELELGWDIDLDKYWKKYLNSSMSKTFLESVYPILYKNPLFSTFIEFRAFVRDTNGFRNTLFNDKTSDNRLHKYCSKFTHESTVLTESDLVDIQNYIMHIEQSSNNLYQEIFKSLSKIYGDSKLFGIYTFYDEIFLQTAKFGMQISKSSDGKISKEYTANTYECFIAEQHLSDTVRQQIEWAKFKVDRKYEHIQQVLTNVLYKCLQEDFRNTMAVRKHGVDYSNRTEVTFSGVFANVYIIESYYHGNKCIKTTKRCMSKKRAAEYVVNRGYYIVGTADSVHKLRDDFTDNNLLHHTRNSMLEHYTQYMVPLENHLKDIKNAYIEDNNRIIELYGSLYKGSKDLVVTQYETDSESVNHTRCVQKFPCRMISFSGDDRHKQQTQEMLSELEKKNKSQNNREEKLTSYYKTINSD